MEFKKDTSKNKNDKKDANEPKLNGEITDFNEALNLAKNEQWYEALKIFNKLLSLPDEINESVEYLLKIMKGKEPFRFSVTTTRDLAAETMTAQIKVDMSGGIVPRIIELRGRCFIEVFAIVSSLIKRGKDVTTEFFSNSRESDQFMKAAIIHAAVSMQLFWESKFIVAFAGGIFYRSSNLEHAVTCMKRALELDPGYEYAAHILSLAKQQLSEASM